MVHVTPKQCGKNVRMNFGKINEVLEMPNLIEVQKNSYKWFREKGLREVFRDVSSITDYNGNLVLNFTDYRIEQIEDTVVPYLSDDDWAEAASEYLSMCADTLDFYAEHGEPLDVDNDTSGWPILLLIVIGVPMIIAGIVCGVLYSQMKTARLKTEANDYIGAGLKLRVQVDNYTHTDRVQVYDPPHEESSSSGGSSVDSDGFGGSSGGSF